MCEIQARRHLDSPYPLRTRQLEPRGSPQCTRPYVKDEAVLLRLPTRTGRERERRQILTRAITREPHCQFDHLVVISRHARKGAKASRRNNKPSKLGNRINGSLPLWCTRDISTLFRSRFIINEEHIVVWNGLAGASREERREKGGHSRSSRVRWSDLSMLDYRSDLPEWRYVSDFDEACAV